jgi:5-enolpyruvylshikimate-3-phosphate synthase
VFRIPKAPRSEQKQGDTAFTTPTPTDQVGLDTATTAAAAAIAAKAAAAAAASAEMALHGITGWLVTEVAALTSVRSELQVIGCAVPTTRECMRIYEDTGIPAPEYNISLPRRPPPRGTRIE